MEGGPVNAHLSLGVSEATLHIDGEPVRFTVGQKPTRADFVRVADLLLAEAGWARTGSWVNVASPVEHRSAWTADVVHLNEKET